MGATGCWSQAKGQVSLRTWQSRDKWSGNDDERVGCGSFMSKLKYHLEWTQTQVDDALWCEETVSSIVVFFLPVLFLPILSTYWMGSLYYFHFAPLSQLFLRWSIAVFDGFGQTAHSQQNKFIKQWVVTCLGLTRGCNLSPFPDPSCDKHCSTESPIGRQSRQFDRIVDAYYVIPSSSFA